MATTIVNLNADLNTDIDVDLDSRLDANFDSPPDTDLDLDFDPEIETALDRVQLSVLSIQRTCVHDGPGIRSTVFFQGCPLRCRWCHNMEAQPFVSAKTPGVGHSISEILRVIRKDREYYRTTHGGVTLSGGEPLAQRSSHLVMLLEALKKDGINVAIETAGDVPWSAFEACLPYVDLFLFDVKAIGDEALHRELTKRPRRRIRENIRRLAATDANIRFRMCVVPGLNDTSANLERTAALLKSVGRPSIELMRYYNLHEQKARKLGLHQEPLNISGESSLQALERASELLSSQGLEVLLPPKATPRSALETERVRKIHQAIRDAGHEVCLESAQLKTTYFKKQGFDGPLPLRRANLLRYLLNKKKVKVYPDELIVGNFTSKRVGGSVWPEYFGAAMAVNLWNIDRQTPVAFKCSREEKLSFYTEIFPYWAAKGLLFKAYPSPKDFLLFVARTLDKKVGFNNNLAGIAHYIVNVERMLRLGTIGLAEELNEKRDEAREAGRDTTFYDGALIALQALEEFAARYSAHLRSMAAATEGARRKELEQMAEICAYVPRNPARTFHEALQSIMFLHIALCTESFENAISLGRLDQVLNPYYMADVEAGRLDYESARELMACFILKFDELIFLNDGDFAFQLGKIFESLSPVETVTVGGVDGAGADITNDVTYMILDVCELKPIGVNMAARIHRESPAEYVERLAGVYLSGSPMPALYNDEPYVAALVKEYDTTLEDARNYSIVGCVEPVASDDHFANTDAANVNVIFPFLQALEGEKRTLWKLGYLDQLDKKALDLLRSGVEKVPFAKRLRKGERAIERAFARLRRPAVKGNGRAGSDREKGSSARYDVPANIDELLERFQDRLNAVVHDILAEQQLIETTLAQNLTTPLASTLYRGCVESGKDVYEGGTTLNSSGIQAVGVTDVVDSLIAIDEVVFQKGLYSLERVLEAMDANFEGEGHQEIREKLLAAPKFGEDSSTDAHLWVNLVLQMYVNALRGAEHKNRNGKYVAGYYGLNTNMVYGLKTPALPSGRQKGTPLANSICPHFGMQMVDLTSALNSVAQVDFASYAPNGTTLTSTIDSGLFPGEGGRKNLAGLIRGYFNQGGMQFQPNLVDRELLLDAYENPGKHKDLVVRIAGYCAYFDDLSDDLKKEIIARSYYTGA